MALTLSHSAYGVYDHMAMSVDMKVPPEVTEVLLKGPHMPEYLVYSLTPEEF